MYSWRQRHDTVVFDEPFYGRFLVDHDPGHPGRDEIIAAMDTDYDTIMATITAPGDRPVRYIKNIAHHLRSVPAEDLLGRCRNVMLIRDPAPVVASLSVRLGDKVEVDWTGFPDLIRVLDFELAEGRDPIVVDSATILADPESALRDLCDRLGLEWDPAVLSWPAGPKPEDGVWAKYWYDNVHRSTGFAAPTQRNVPELNEAQSQVFDACIDSYQRLASYVRAA